MGQLFDDEFARWRGKAFARDRDRFGGQWGWRARRLFSDDDRLGLARSGRFLADDEWGRGWRLAVALLLNDDVACWWWVWGLEESVLDLLVLDDFVLDSFADLWKIEKL